MGIISKLISKIKQFILNKKQKEYYVHYMATGESLPKPFTKEEEDEKIADHLR